MKLREIAPILLLASGGAHLMHLNTKSLVKHQVTQEFYEKFPGMVDQLLEAYMVKNPASFTFDGWLYKGQPSDDVANFLEGIDKALQSVDGEDLTPALQSQVDSIQLFLRQLYYKVTRLS